MSNRKAKVFNKSLMEFGISESEKQYKDGLRISAVIEAEDIFGKYSMDTYINEIKNNEKVVFSKIFKELNNAIEWIKAA